MPTETRKPLDTGLGSAMDEAVPLYPTEATTPAYAAACLPDRLRSAACLDRVHFDVPTDEQELVNVLHEAADKIEAADALLSLSTRYREAYSAFEAATLKAGQPLSMTEEGREIVRTMEIARANLLSATLDIA